MPVRSEEGAAIRRPGRWVLERADGIGGFTTGLRWERHDGTSAQWESRTARRRGRIQVHGAEGGTSAVEAEPTTVRRLRRLNVVAAVSFVLGGSLFALGAYLAQAGIGAARTVDDVYLVGGVFFSLGGYVSVLQATNAPTEIDEHGTLRSARWRWWRSRPHDLGWASAVVLFAGTLAFGVSLVAAFAEDLTVRQTNTWMWLPDMAGCVCFLVSGHLAQLEIGHGHVRVRSAELGWWVVAVNQVGSILFFFAGLAAYTRPATEAVLYLGLVNWGTFAGAAGFVIGGFLQIFERPVAPSDR
ncbi:MULTISPECIES: hypothetical protein [unclassified Mumia]|uniref:hypothetical protein n=1 Tax=unclassified Mumia TaxID=2621872 RepID=UPI001AB038F9|nr:MULTISPECIES: hypothetical protein [unclassified Mumia]